MAHLHLELLVLGSVVGALGALIARWDSLRHLAMPAAVAVVLFLWIFENPKIAIPLLVLGVCLAGLGLSRVRGIGRGRTYPTMWVPWLALPIVGIVYLSVPDTEGPVLLGSMLVPFAAAEWRRQRSSPLATIIGWTTSLVSAIAAVTIVGAAGRFSMTGWWTVKAALAMAEALLAAAAISNLRSNAPARRPQ